MIVVSTPRLASPDKSLRVYDERRKKWRTLIDEYLDPPQSSSHIRPETLTHGRFQVRLTPDEPWHTVPGSDVRNYFHVCYNSPADEDQPDDVEVSGHWRYMSKDLDVHPQQVDAAQDIAELILRGARNVLLVAQMQAGKTGTVRFTLFLLQYVSMSLAHTEKFRKEKVYFICGMNDNDLLHQARRELGHFIPEENIMFNKQLQQVMHVWSDSQLQTLDPALVVVDESHYGSNVEGMVDEFLSLFEKKPYVLSVSATAMAEVVSAEASGTTIVSLGTSDEYYSLDEMDKRGLLRQSHPVLNGDGELSPEFIDIFEDEYSLQHKRKERKYNIIRVPTWGVYIEIQEHVKEYCYEMELIDAHSTAETGDVDDFNDYIREEPALFTLIVVYGKLRAGKQLDTTHVGFLYDTASSTPDVIAQSLAGRACGYGKRWHGVRVYTDCEAARAMVHWTKHGYSPDHVPKGSKGVIGGTSPGEQWLRHVPLLLRPQSEVIEWVARMFRKHGYRYTYKNQFFDALRSLDDTGTLNHIFDTYDPEHNCGLMILDEGNACGSFYKNWVIPLRSWMKGTNYQGVSAVLPGRYFSVRVNLRTDDPYYGHVIVLYKDHVSTAHKGDQRSVALVRSNSRFAKKKS